MKFSKASTQSFRKVLEPVTERFVSPTYIVNLDEAHIENIAKVESSPPRIGSDDFGKFKITYRTPHLCEVNR